jgi:serine/threonine protein kinase
MISTIVGKYRLTRLIGEVGMASVYEAEHTVLGSKAAIKVLDPLLSATGKIRERLVNEARTMSSLSHPNITRVLDFEEQPNRQS